MRGIKEFTAMGEDTVRRKLIERAFDTDSSNTAAAWLNELDRLRTHKRLKITLFISIITLFGTYLNIGLSFFRH